MVLLVTLNIWNKRDMISERIQHRERVKFCSHKHLQLSRTKQHEIIKDFFFYFSGVGNATRT